MPNPDMLCVVSQGAGYIVSTSQPDIWEEVALAPIIDVRRVQAAGVVVFATYTEILAYGAEGVTWRTRRLSWDGLKIVSVDAKVLVGEYWDVRSEAMQHFQVDLVSGESSGGAE
jgi:hypothetical protein